MQTQIYCPLHGARDLKMTFVEPVGELPDEYLKSGFSLTAIAGNDRWLYPFKDR